MRREHNKNKFTIEDVCRIFDVPINMVRPSIRAKNKHRKHEIVFLVKCVIPWMNAIANSIGDNDTNK